MKLRPIGHFSKPHGLKGHLILFTEFDLKNKLKVIFIEQSGSQAPYFIEEFKPFNKGFLVKLEAVNDVNAANLLKNKDVLAEEKFIIEEESFEYLNFLLIDEEKGEVGLIQGLTGSDANPLFVIVKDGKEILLPFSDEFVTKIVKTKKQIFYKAPEGLLDLYL